MLDTLSRWNQTSKDFSQQPVDAYGKRYSRYRHWADFQCACIGFRIMCSVLEKQPNDGVTL